MQKCGLIGGIGPESTLNYYASLTRAFQSRSGTESGPPLVLNSIDLPRMIGLLQDDNLEGLTRYLVSAVEECALAGAQFAALAACTPHVVFEELERRCTIPLLSIVEATRERALQLGVKRAALFGTRFTMQGEFFATAFRRSGIAILVPPPLEQDYVHNIYFVRGIVDRTTRERLMGIVDGLKQREGIEALILGGTELSLMFSEARVCGISILDSTGIHVEALISRMLQGGSV